jgi:putative intracellular protease/amidase
MKMDKKAHLLVFDGLADWEPALAICELNQESSYKQSRYDVVTVGFTTKPVVSMGGLKIVPDITLADLRPEDSVVFIVPGGNRWESQPDGPLTDVLQRLHNNGVPIAAICGATLAFARAGLLRGIRHTSNMPGYIPYYVREYSEQPLYVDRLAVCDSNIVTASGVGQIEFAYEILKLLGIYDDQNLKTWFDLYKNGKMPVSTA